MKRVLGIRGAFVVATAGFALVAAVASAQSPSAEGDRATFVRYCSSCHGRTGRGDGPVADGFRIRPQDLTQFARRNGGMFPAEQTRRLVDGRDARVRAHGASDMPVWGDAFVKREGLDDKAAKARIDAVVRFLESIQERAGH